MSHTACTYPCRPIILACPISEFTWPTCRLDRWASRNISKLMWMNKYTMYSCFNGPYTHISCIKVQLYMYKSCKINKILIYLYYQQHACFTHKIWIWFIKFACHNGYNGQEDKIGLNAPSFIKLQHCSIFSVSNGTRQ